MTSNCDIKKIPLSVLGGYDIDKVVVTEIGLAMISITSKNEWVSAVDSPLPIMPISRMQRTSTLIIKEGKLVAYKSVRSHILERQISEKTDYYFNGNTEDSCNESVWKSQGEVKLCTGEELCDELSDDATIGDLVEAAMAKLP